MSEQDSTWEDSQEAGVARRVAKKTLAGSEVKGKGPGRSPEAVSLALPQSTVEGPGCVCICGRGRANGKNGML